MSADRKRTAANHKFHQGAPMRGTSAYHVSLLRSPSPSHMDRHNLASKAQVIEIIAPPLGHFNALIPILAPRVRTAHSIAVPVRQSALDRIGMPFSAFVEESARCRTEAVGGDGVPIKSQTAEGLVNGILAHRLEMTTLSRKYIVYPARMGPHFLEQCDGLLRQRHAVRPAQFRSPGIRHTECSQLTSSHLPCRSSPGRRNIWGKRRMAIFTVGLPPYPSTALSSSPSLAGSRIAARCLTTGDISASPSNAAGSALDKPNATP